MRLSVNRRPVTTCPKSGGRWPALGCSPPPIPSHGIGKSPRRGQGSAKVRSGLWPRIIKLTCTPPDSIEKPLISGPRCWALACFLALHVKVGRVALDVMPSWSPAKIHAACFESTKMATPLLTRELSELEWAELMTREQARIRSLRPVDTGRAAVFQFKIRPSGHHLSCARPAIPAGDRELVSPARAPLPPHMTRARSPSRSLRPPTSSTAPTTSKTSASKPTLTSSSWRRPATTLSRSSATKTTRRRTMDACPWKSIWCVLVAVLTR
jgi:hypothetical protein